MDAELLFHSPCIFCVSFQMQNINLCIIKADKNYLIRLIRPLNYMHVGDILHTILYTGSLNWSFGNIA